MISIIKRKLVAKPEPFFKEVHITNCVHFCGFRYGGQQYHPYETYLTELRKGTDLQTINNQFVNFLRYYQPRSMNEALGIMLSKEYPTWKFPWDHHASFELADNSDQDPDDVIDLLTYYSKYGILSFRIDQEIYWLHRAIKNIQQFGYAPQKYTYIEALMFENRKNEFSYLLLDGNHRISALHALGYSKILIRVAPKHIVREIDVDGWPSVKNGLFTKADALLIFNRYFEGNTNFITNTIPAAVLDYSNNYQHFNNKLNNKLLLTKTR